MKESVGLSPLELAEQKTPKRWYEVSSQSDYWKFALVGSMGMLAYYFGYHQAYGDLFMLRLLNIPIDTSEAVSRLPHYWLSSAFGAVATFLDTHSTAEAFDAADTARRKEIAVMGQEANPMLRHIKNSQQLLKSPLLHLIECTAITLSVISPGLGFPVAAIKTLAALNNYRGAQRIKLSCGLT